MKILLAHGYFLKRDAAEQKVMKPYPPLGLLYLSATLKKADYQVRIFDGTFQDYADFEKEVAFFKPDIVGFYANMMTRHHVLKLRARITDPKIRTLVGGPDPPHYAESYLDAGFEVVIVGEGEGALLKLLGAWEQPDTWETLPGLIFRKDGNTVRTPTPKPKTPLDEFPFPDRGAIDLDLYLDCWEKHHGMRPISLITSRGCPFQCTWCSHNVYGYSLRKRSPENVLLELSHLAESYRFDAYWFADDVFTIQPKWTLKFRDLLMENPTLIKPFECISRADKLNDEIIQALQDTACKRLWVGAESGSQRLLDLMKRGVKRDQVINAVTSLRAAGIEAGMFFMWGFREETLEDVIDTVNLAKECIPDIALTTIAYPIRGTTFYKQLEEAGSLEENLPFDQGTDRDIRIRGQAGLELYSQANRFLHATLGAARLRQGTPWQQLKAVAHEAKAWMISKQLKSAFASHRKLQEQNPAQRRLAS